MSAPVRRPSSASSNNPADSGPGRILIPYDIVLPHEKTIIARKVGMKAKSLSRIFRNPRKIGVTIENNTAVIADVGVLCRALETGTAM